MSTSGYSVNPGHRPPCRSAPAQDYWQGHGQGKRATTILADQGDVVTVITDVPYSLRDRTGQLQQAVRGSRPMHRSTLTIPCSSYTDYTTTFQTNHGGSRTKDIPERRYLCPSAHVSQITFREQHQKHYPWYTHYRCNYFGKETDSPRSLKLPEFTNMLAMTEGSGTKQALTAASGAKKPSYWTQYGRIHNKLGVMLGPGVTRDLPLRKAYNPITGEELRATRQEDNKRTSGDRLLYSQYRNDSDKQPILG